MYQLQEIELTDDKRCLCSPKPRGGVSLLTGSRWFSVLDLKLGCYQVELEEANKQTTAFVSPLGFWEFNVTGGYHAPNTLQRLMEQSMGDLNRREALFFIDDLIVVAKNLK